MSDISAFYYISGSNLSPVINISGSWILKGIERLDSDMRALPYTLKKRKKKVCFNFSALEQIDTAGAWILHRTASKLIQNGVKVYIKGMKKNHRSILDMILLNKVNDSCTVKPMPVIKQIVMRIGLTVIETISVFKSNIIFFGRFIITIINLLRSPRRFPVTQLLYHMEKAGIDTIPLISVLTLLIGGVFAQQGAVALQRFGADVFMVNLIAISFLREIGILLSAIIVAGHSGSAFTAEIGTMKIQEEIDAMHTFGIDPMEALVVPRVLALVIMLPLITFVADIMGLIGGALVAWLNFSIYPGVYIMKVQQATSIWTFATGIIKAPFMAFTIGIISCHLGLTTKYNSQSLGYNTTCTVVRTIFMVITLDALFALFFTAIGI